MLHQSTANLGGLSSEIPESLVKLSQKKNALIASTTSGFVSGDYLFNFDGPKRPHDPALRGSLWASPWLSLIETASGTKCPSPEWKRCPVARSPPKGPLCALTSQRYSPNKTGPGWIPQSQGESKWLTFSYSLPCAVS